ncbi:MAG: hypothetical protein DI601_00325 [Azospirillum brasilense]|nr:MAG: hypothetical protein DI601_00325 [Azospirillum brasilense]
MINIDEAETDTTDILIHEAIRLELLAARLRRVAAGEAPTVAELDAARQLEGWQISRREVPVIMTGDAEGPTIQTPDVVVLAPVSGWALTSCGWLALGERRPMEYRVAWTDETLASHEQRMADGARDI